MAAATALRAIRDVGAVQAGQRVLVNGAAGGVGHFAVQIAAALGAEVTAVCSAANTDLVGSLGAAEVIDYATSDFTTRHAHYDVILDNVGNRPLRRLRHALAPTGTLAFNAGGSPGKVIGAVGSFVKITLVNGVVRQHLRSVPTNQNRDDLLALRELVEDGRLRPVISRTYPLGETAAGLRHVEQGHARGKLVITVA
jgi:NADPH:quinone reductase-like Zn-dependent oxidoreductase